MTSLVTASYYDTGRIRSSRKSGDKAEKASGPGPYVTDCGKVMRENRFRCDGEFSPDRTVDLHRPDDYGIRGPGLPTLGFTSCTWRSGPRYQSLPFDIMLSLRLTQGAFLTLPKTWSEGL
jgi:hypothetical protein